MKNLRPLLWLCALTVLASFALRFAGSGHAQSDDESHLRVRLSEPRDPAATPKPSPRATPVTAQPISDTAAQALLKRLSPLQSDKTDTQPFALRPGSPPRPQVGQTLNEPFPPLSSAPPPANSSGAANGSLEVLRFAPVGEQAADQAGTPPLSVTFSQAMVAVSSNDEVNAAAVPVKLTPQPPGRWRWIGTKTVTFEPSGFGGRFPMATRYTVEIPARTKAINGQTLPATKQWSFSTPPLVAQSAHPAEPSMARDPLLFLAFNQRIDPAALLPFISLTSEGRQWPLRLATAEEIKADEDTADRVRRLQPSHWLALRVVKQVGEPPLPIETWFRLNVTAGAPSAEGPVKTAEVQVSSFRTYGKLRVMEHSCQYPNRKTDCDISSHWRVQFSNPVHEVDASQIRVEPQLASINVSANYNNEVIITGHARPRTTYKVTLDPSITDVYGQQLGETVTVNFSTGPAPIGLSVPGNGFVVLDPMGPRRLPIYSVNHPSLKVTLYAVAPEQYGEFAAQMRAAYSYDRAKRERQPPRLGREVFAQTIELKAQPDELIETPIDLTPALTNGLGHALLVVEPTINLTNAYGPPFWATWIQATNISLDAFADQSSLLAWATSLKDGRALTGVKLQLIERLSAGEPVLGLATTTSGEGIARIELPRTSTPPYLIARQGGDAALLPQNTNFWGEFGWSRKAKNNDVLAWHVFDDRALYRPGEQVHVKGWVRRIGAGAAGDVTLPGGEVKNLTYKITDARDNAIAEGALQLNALGGFDLAFKLPADANLGHAQIKFKAETPLDLDGDEATHTFQIQEFRRPEFEMKVAADAGPHFVDAPVEATAQARYYAGGGLPDAKIEWRVSSFSTNFTPPNRGDFTFGQWLPWWSGENEGRASTDEEFAGRTDASGKHRLQIDFEAANPPRPRLIYAEGSVQDVNRQRIAGSTQFILHPAAHYVGLRSPRLFVAQGKPLVIEAIIADLDGKLIANREIKMRAVRVDSVYEKGQWREREADAQDCAVTSAEAAATCRFATNEGGRYRVTARITDEQGRANETELTRWVAGGKRLPQQTLAQEKIELIPSAREYQPGETAELLLQAPFFPAEGLLTVRRAGIVSSERFTLTSASHTLRIPIKDEHTPNITVQVDLVGATARTDEAGNTLARLPQRPAFASGELALRVPPIHRRLTVRAEPRAKTLEPGGATTVDLEVRDAAGKPVRGSEVAVIVVDEAVLALTDYKLADPLKTFYSERAAEVSDHHLRNALVLAPAQDLISRTSDREQVLGLHELDIARFYQSRHLGAMNEMVQISAESSAVVVTTTGVEAPINLRRNFAALAVFAPSVLTDARGRASVAVKLPDNLTRYRVMAVAVAGERQFGTGEATITARLPLMVRPSAPRFLNFGDRFELLGVVQNQTDQINAGRCGRARHERATDRRAGPPRYRSRERPRRSPLPRRRRDARHGALPNRGRGHQYRQGGRRGPVQANQASIGRGRDLVACLDARDDREFRHLRPA